MATLVYKVFALSLKWNYYFLLLVVEVSRVEVLTAELNQCCKAQLTAGRVFLSVRTQRPNMMGRSQVCVIWVSPLSSPDSHRVLYQ